MRSARASQARSVRNAIIARRAAAAGTNGNGAKDVRIDRFVYSSLMKSARGSWSMLLIATTSMPLGRLAPLGR